MSFSLQNHHGQGQVVFVGEAQVQAGDAGRGAELGGLTRDPELRLTPGIGHHLHLPPADAVLPQAHPQGLGEGLLGRKAQGQARGGPRLAPAVGDLLGREDPVQKPVAVAPHHPGDAGHPHQINADAVDHERRFSVFGFRFSVFRFPFSAPAAG
jgi:hypothetical protein